MNKLLFIEGCPRSGTTLVKRLLNSHDDIYCGPEFGNLEAILNIYNTMKKGIENERLKEYLQLEDLKLYYYDFIYKLLSKPTKNTKITYLAEKTPSNIKVFTHLHEIFPEAQLLHVIRNPFDVVTSILNVGKRSSNLPEHYYDVRKAAIFWRQTVNWITRFETSKTLEFQQQYKILKYEDLLHEPRMVVEDLLNWLDVKVDFNIINLSEKEGQPNSFGNIFYTSDEYYKNFDTNNINKYKNSLSEQEKKIVLEETKNELIKFGYMSSSEINICTTNKNF